MFADFPTKSTLPEGDVIATVQAQVAAVYAATGAARNLRAEYRVPSGKKVAFILKPGVTWAHDHIPDLRPPHQCGGGERRAAYEAPGGVPRALTPLGELYMPLDGIVDSSAELGPAEEGDRESGERADHGPQEAGERKLRGQRAAGGGAGAPAAGDGLDRKAGPAYADAGGAGGVSECGMRNGDSRNAEWGMRNGDLRKLRRS